MSEYYEFEQLLEGLDEEMLLTVAGIIGIVALVIGLLAIVFYVFQSVGLYTIAKRRGIANPWLAWLPVGNYWIAGSIADQYQYVVNGAVKNKRKILLALNIASFVISGLVSGFYNGMVLYAGDGYLGTYLSMSSIVSLLTSGISIATLVFWHWSLYELYTSCKPRSNMLFLILGIFFGFLIPFFIFACRNKEEGMPPRRDDPRYQYQYQAAPSQPAPQPQPEPRTYKDPWEN